MSAPFIHHTALIEEHVKIGAGTSIWDHAHLRRGAVVGENCIVGGKSYLANSVRMGDRCKVNAMVYLCSGVTLGDGVFIAAHTTFTNDFYPRACVNDLSELRPSEVDEHTTFTTVQDGVTIGACGNHRLRRRDRPVRGHRDGRAWSPGRYRRTRWCWAHPRGRWRWCAAAVGRSRACATASWPTASTPARHCELTYGVRGGCRCA